MQLQAQRVAVEWWDEKAVDDQVSTYKGVLASLEVEADEGRPGRVAIHTFVDGNGSLSSFYLDRESALSLARDILKTIALD